MNWYKKAQEMMQGTPGTYTYLGHEKYRGNFSKGREEQLWVWDPSTGKFKTSPATYNTTHEELSERNDYYSGRLFEGRYENYHGNKRISVKAKGRQIPDDLIAELVAEYGKDIKIFTY